MTIIHSANSFGKTINIKSFYDSIICGNSVDVLKTFPANSVNLFITSPPYNSKNSTGNGMKDGRGGKWENAALQKCDLNFHLLSLKNNQEKEFIL